MTSHIPHIIRPPSPDTPPLSRAAFIRRLKLKHHRPHPTYDKNDDKNDGDDSTGQENPGLSSSSSSTSPTPSTRSPISPVVDDGPPGDGAGDGTKGSADGQRWILSAACDEELKEWGLYLGDAVEDSSGEENRRRRLSGDTAASSERWSAIAASCGEYTR